MDHFGTMNGSKPEYRAHAASMSWMGLSAIPADLPSDLTDLDLSFNSNTQLDAVVLSKLTRLTCLSLYGNRIAQLTPLPALPSLAHLSLGAPLLTAVSTASILIYMLHYS